MEQITMKDAELVGGSGIVGWGFGQLAGPAIKFVYEMVRAGEVDYSGVSEQQGSYYNMVGA